MCFSATASFTAGVLLLGAGALTVRSARSPRELPLAAIPRLFSIQQLIEGVVWLTFRYEAPLLNESALFDPAQASREEIRCTRE